MAPKALIFTGIGSLADCAESDLRAWNAAFRAHGLRWQWSWDTFIELMRHGGARNPAERFAAHMGETIDIAQITASHRRQFNANLAGEIPLRAGVERVLLWAAQSGSSVALCTRAPAAVVHALLRATARERAGVTFDTLVNAEDVDRLAPHPDAISLIMERLRMNPEDCLSIVDTPVSAAAALDAGLKPLAVPGRLSEGQAFPKGTRVSTRLVLEELAPEGSVLASQAAE